MGVNNVGDCESDIGLSDGVLCGGLLRLGVCAWATCWSLHVTSFFLTGQHDLASSRDDAGEWRERYKGHLLHELVCVSGTKWLETGDQKALRATHGSQRLLMPGKPSMWAKFPRSAHVNDYPFSVEESEKKKSKSKCQSHRMMINPSTACSLKLQPDVWPFICVRGAFIPLPFYLKLC